MFTQLFRFESSRERLVVKYHCRLWISLKVIQENTAKKATRSSPEISKTSPEPSLAKRQLPKVHPRGLVVPRGQYRPVGHLPIVDVVGQ